MDTMITIFQSVRGKGRGFQSLEDALWARVIPGPGGCLVYDWDPDAYGYGNAGHGMDRPRLNRSESGRLGASARWNKEMA